MAFLGIGPGRCGTMSLAKMLNGCRKVWAIHEEYRIALNVMDIISAADRESWRPFWNIGFIGLSWTRNVMHARRYLPDCPVVCLHRPKDEVVASFAKTAITKLNATGWGEPEIPDGEETAKHWDKCEEAMLAVPEPVLHVETKNLSADDTIKEIFSFVGIPESHQVMPEKRVWNTREHQCRANERRAAIHQTAATAAPASL